MSLAEVHALLGELDDVWCFVRTGGGKVAEFFYILPAEIIDVEDNEVRFCRIWN